MASRKKHGGVYATKTGLSSASVAERRKAIGDKLSFSASEAYKLLRTNIIYSMADEEGCKVIGVTSALRGEGKSTTSLNLAYTLAVSGKRVLLLEADLRIPSQAAVLKVAKTPGLSEVLVGEAPLAETIQYGVLLKTLALLPAGQIPPNPAELLSSKRMEQVLEALVGAFEYIIVDLPPVNAVSDGLVLSKQLSGMLVVVRQEYCDQVPLAEAMRRMELLNVKILGFVLNDAESEEKRHKKYGKSYKYGYSYRYGQKVNGSTAPNGNHASSPEHKSTIE